ncbi:origin of replication complex subunit 1A-like [Cynara cardunculus var. scolymus]|uniref:origin of replication complex subunit 1A-like n=1 Tax=Cynara cardunculus var. scolymus TaxID=59895 RepID=UPI000D624763|nr:origin of replication complex subunit 1A-like [Cynara cardunculus var. scolymus]
MAETPKKLRQTPQKSLKSTPKTPSPQTPQTLVSPRRSSRLSSSPPPSRQKDLPVTTPRGSINQRIKYAKNVDRLKKKLDASDPIKHDDAFSPVSPDRTETKKRKSRTENVGDRVKVKVLRNKKEEGKKRDSTKPKRRVYYKKVSYDGGEFAVGDDVYVKRREDASSDDDEPEVEECRVCFRTGRNVMIECDDCLGGFHLKCLKPPLRKVPEEDWICGYCEAKKLGKKVELPEAPTGKKRRRTAKEKLLSSDLWAARIESLWKEVDGSFWFRGQWYIIPEETSAGRQPHNLKRELYRTNDFADNEMETVLRHCFVKTPNEYAKAENEGDDVFLCEYEYDVKWHSFKRIADVDNNKEDDEEADHDEDWSCNEDSDSETDEDLEYEKEDAYKSIRGSTPGHEVAANSRKGHTFGLQKIGTKRIPEHVRSHKPTELEKAKATLLLATLPKSLPCRNKEMEEITAFIKGAICDNQCLGRCLYIHGVPGTGKTMSVLSVMRSLRSEVEAGITKPYSFVEINGLKLAAAENIYRVIYEALTGHRVSWKKALNLLNDRFSNGTKSSKDDDRPCILLIDELDLLVTRNQSVLYNILDWPTKQHSKLIVIGIANTMDLPEKLLPRISSRMGIQRLCFAPYNYLQLQEIIACRLKGIDAFEKQAIEFASRKVAAVSGDARRALEICRRAAELADYRVKKSISLPKTGKSLVGMAEVEAAIQEMFQAPHIQVMRSCSKLSKVFLAAMVHELYKTGMSETTFEKLAQTVSCLCTSNGITFPGWDTLLRIGCKLGESRIVLSESGASHRLQKLQLNFPSDDVSFALKDSEELPWLTKYI